MRLKNIDYTNCLTNLTCSILKYFNCEYKHNTLLYVDKILQTKKPRNVILILCDGMGYNILNKTLNKNSFLVKNIKQQLLSVFPPTTTAATTSIITGLNPNEHCWLGWDIYMKEINEVVTMYLNKIKDTDKLISNENICNKYMGYKTIFDYINVKNHSIYLSPFLKDKYIDFDDMLIKIKENCNIKDKNFIYAYYENPDALMHDYGTNDINVIENINMINDKLENFSKTLDNDTIMFIIADHGHINSNSFYLEDYEDIFDMLIRNTSIDSRSSMFFIKDGMKDKFKSLFNKYFKDYFILLDKEEIYNYKIFGTGINHPHFDSSIGDFIAISIKNKNIRYKRVEGKVDMKSSHAGNTPDETIVPLIIVGI